MGWLSRLTGRAEHRPITRVADYRGEDRVLIAATQLGDEYTRSQARRIVDEWVEFFAAGPSPIRDLQFISRTPKRMFEALSGQTQLKALEVKWGDYSDLTPVAGMVGLRKLILRGAAAVEDFRPLADLALVEELALEGFRRARDLSPVGEMAGVVDLELGGGGWSMWTAHVDSFGFLRKMPQLRSLLLHTIKADDLDYSPLLTLPNVTSGRVMAVRGMRPTFDALRVELPWLE